MKSFKIAVDFDGTVVKHDYPRIGEDIKATKVLQRLVNSGHKIILNTMRSGKELEDAIEWFKENDVTLYSVNKDPEQEKWTNSTKCFAHIYIDDAALGVPIAYDPDGRRFVDWKRVENMLESMNLIPAYLTKEQLRREKEQENK